ncbi:MAG: hypothetical protein IPP79_05015 [Chitinophagaceae bacterium]|nr:hypothetical protein [Chitinophagaceae bacterium]
MWVSIVICAKKMLDDVTPPYGQYANPDNIDQFSIFRLSPGFIRKRAYANLPVYTDAYGKVDVVLLPDGRSTSPGSLSVIDFIDNFKPSWADTLLQLHPEYCQFREFDALQASHVWDEKFSNTNTFKAAVDSGYLNPASFSGLPSTSIYTYYSNRRDPLFIDLKPTYKAEMLDSLMKKTKDAQGQWVSAWSLATIMAHCQSADLTCFNTYKSLSAAFTSDTACSGELDMAWRYFREMYLQEKREIINKIITANCGSSLSLDPSKNYVHFQNPNTMIAGLPTISTSNQTLTDFIDDNCTNAAVQWWLELESCGYTKDDSSIIVPRLIQVCKEGGDSGHPFGSSTVKPSSTYAYRSFDQVLREYNPQKYNASCNAYLITSIRPYEQKIVYYEKQVLSKPDSCECSMVSNWYSRFQAEKLTNENFSQFIFRNAGLSISTPSLDSLRQVCNGTINCTTLKSPLVIPSIFQCSVSAVCADCKLIRQTYDSYKTSFPMQFPKKDPATDGEEMINTTFRNYMNAQLGFGKEVADYLEFMDSCQIGYSGTLVSTCDTLNSILAQYLDTSAKNSSYYSTSISTGITNAIIVCQTVSILKQG